MLKLTLADLGVAGAERGRDARPVGQQLQAAARHIHKSAHLGVCVHMGALNDCACKWV